MNRQPTRDVTFVLRVWLEADECEPKARLLRTDDDAESTAVGSTAIVGLVDAALAEFLGRTA